MADVFRRHPCPAYERSSPLTTTLTPSGVDLESEILSRVIDPDSPTLSADAARSLIAIGFSEADLSRMNKLAESGRQGQLSPDENAALDAYLSVGRFLALVQAKARLSLRRLSSSQS